MSLDKATGALRVALIRALLDRLKVEDTHVRDSLTAQTVPGERVPAILPGHDEPVAWVTRTKPTKAKPALVVKDPKAYLQWVLLNRPGEAVQPPMEVRSSFTAAVSADGGIVEPSTGELVIPTGMEWATPEPGRSQLRVVLEDGGAEAIEAAWAAGDLPMLPAGES